MDTVPNTLGCRVQVRAKIESSLQVGSNWVLRAIQCEELHDFPFTSMLDWLHAGRADLGV